LPSLYDVLSSHRIRRRLPVRGSVPRQIIIPLLHPPGAYAHGRVAGPPRHLQASVLRHLFKLPLVSPLYSCAGSYGRWNHFFLATGNPVMLLLPDCVILWSPSLCTPLFISPFLVFFFEISRQWHRFHNPSYFTPSLLFSTP